MVESTGAATAETIPQEIFDIMKQYAQDLIANSEPTEEQKAKMKARAESSVTEEEFAKSVRD